MSAPPVLPDVPALRVEERLAQLAALAALEAELEPEDEASGADEAPDGAARCMGETAAGEPCGMFRLKGSLFCWHHDPDRRAAAEGEQAARLRAQAEARAARATQREREAWACGLETPAQLAAFVAMVTRAVWDRRIAPDDAQACLEGARLLAELLRERGEVGWC
jgi:hypothetical protein